MDAWSKRKAAVLTRKQTKQTETKIFIGRRKKIRVTLRNQWRSRNSSNLARKLISPENLVIPKLTNQTPLTSKPNLTLNSTLNSL